MKTNRRHSEKSELFTLRLEIRAQEGRIGKEDLIVAGLDKVGVAESEAKA